MREVVEASKYFDGDWYLSQYPDVGFTGMPPAEHYLRFGARMLRDPGPEFSTSFYLAAHPDVARAGVNPLVHYMTNGRREGRRIAPAPYRMQPDLPRAPVPRYTGKPPSHSPARIVSFYLPQFHPIPENDAWWGPGFTEWTNVEPARPQFAEHHQPHVPGELGYYDLRDTSVQRQQIELARLYGVGGFCFYFYWFAGKRLLETPVLNYLNDPSLDFPFMLCWANENWSRRWDGRDDDVLIGQQHSPEDDLYFISYVAKYLKDPRYIRVGGRPVLLVYRPGLLPNAAETAARWRDWCRMNGVGEIYLAYTQSFEATDPGEYGFDAAIEFPPNNSHLTRVNGHCRPQPNFEGNIYDWTTLVERSYSYSTPAYPLFRGLCPSWDNTARRGLRSTILVNNTPGQFARWATHAIRDTRTRFSQADEQLVFVNAWNEWAEGAHLEPDRTYGYAWLEALLVAQACGRELPPVPGDPRVAILLEGDDVAALRRDLKALERMSERHQLFVSLPPENAEAVAAELEAFDGECTRLVRGSVNAGPSGHLPEVLRSLDAQGFDLVARVGGDGSPGSWADVLGDPDEFDRLCARFSADPNLGMLLPSCERRTTPRSVGPATEELGSRLGLTPEEVELYDVWSGRQFIARVGALAPLASLAISKASTDPTSAAFRPDLDGGLSRCAALSAVACGLRVAGTELEPEGSSGRGVVIVSHDAHPHGAQMLALNMARNYRDMGYDVDTLMLGDGPLLGDFRTVSTVHLVDLSSDRVSRVRTLLEAIRAKGSEFALVNTTVSGSILGVIKEAGFQAVSLVHEMPRVLHEYDLGAQARAIGVHADAVVFPSEVVQAGFEEFAGTPLERAVVRPQGLYLRSPHRSSAARERMRVAVRRRLGLRSANKIMLGVGYADQRKGVDLFVEAGIHAVVADPDLVAVWIGKLGPREPLQAARERIREAGLEDRFRFPGLVDNPADYYAAADVYVLSSREDPFPSVVLEAMDAELPVIAFQGTTGSEELISRGVGVLVPAFDTERLAQEVGRLLRDPVRAAEMGRRGREIIDAEFNFRHYLLDLAALGGARVPRVSVVVPNYNYAEYIASRLRSIESQRFPIFELIVLDDASTDSSVDVIEETLSSSHLSVKLVVNETNSGSVFSQWRRGVELASGDLVWIAEADDLADPDFLATVVPAFEDPDVVMSYSESRQMASDGTILSDNYLNYVADIDRERWTRPYVATGREEIETALHVKNTIPNVSAVVFRREALLQVLREHGDEIASYRNAGDWVAYLRLLERGSIAFTPQPVNSHRRHESSVTVSSFDVRQLREIMQVQVDVVERFSLGPEAAQAALTYAQRLYEQFGLDSPERTTVAEHPELSSLADSLLEASAGVRV